jgi:hypothetical protein
MNWYAYVGNRPVVWIDPAGLYEETSSTWDNMWQLDSLGLAGKGAAAWADGMLPFVDPFQSFGVYNPCDDWLDASQTMGFVTRNAMLAAAGASAAGRHRLPPHITRQTGVPRKVAGHLHQNGVRIPHLNLPRSVHVIVNRYNWYKPWKWIARGQGK